MTSSPYTPVIVYGIGNPDRSDDGIGKYCIDSILAKKETSQMLSHVHGKAIFHLTIDELEFASKFSDIVLIDASIDNRIKNFSYSQIKPDVKQQFTTHLLTPEEFLSSIIQLFDSHPTIHLISIRGYQWQISNKLSPLAKVNANKALDFFYSKFQALECGGI
ncbi:MAG: hypothetical protein N2662_10580 [Bacteroidales bacterium]|nr:hypothetical protein [Bacteroidales bacterium]